MKRRNLVLSMGLIFVMLMGTLSGCSSSDKDSSEAFQTVFCGMFMSHTAIDEFGNSLSADMPQLTVEGKEPLFTPMVMGEVENDLESGVINDPMVGAGGIIKFSAMLASNEIDVIISDYDNAVRSAASGSFMPLEEILTEAEMAELEDKLMSFEIMEIEGDEQVSTGEYTPVCGVNITGSEYITQIYGDQEVGVFIAANTKKPELSKEVLLSLI